LLHRPSTYAPRDSKHPKLGIYPNVSKSVESKENTELHTGGIKLREPDTLTSSLSIFRPWNSVRGKRLVKSNDIRDLGTELSVPPSNKPHTGGEQLLRLSNLLATALFLQ
jgi:hypothetical protein